MGGKAHISLYVNRKSHLCVSVALIDVIRYMYVTILRVCLIDRLVVRSHSYQEKHQNGVIFAIMGLNSSLLHLRYQDQFCLPNDDIIAHTKDPSTLTEFLTCDHAW